MIGRVQGTAQREADCKIRRPHGRRKNPQYCIAAHGTFRARKAIPALACTATCKWGCNHDRER